MAKSQDKVFWSNLWWLLLYIGLGIVALGVLMLALTPFLSDTHFDIGWIQSTLGLHILQWMQTIFIMALPPVLWAKVILKESPIEALLLRRASWKVLVCCAIAAVVLAWLMDQAAEGIKLLPWPADLVAKAEREAAQQEALLTSLLSVGGFWGWMELVLLMSLATAVAEELMFRGALVRCFRFTPMGDHLIAVVVGLVFAYIHFDLYGLVPRWVMGFVLCEVSMRYRSLWPAIVMHAVNNLMALIEFKI